MITIQYIKRNVINKEYQIKVDRTSPLGNPFFMNGEDKRDEVCDKYEAWLRNKIASKDREVCNELNKLYKIYKQYNRIIYIYMHV